jgi:hypothetical protein
MSSSSSSSASTDPATLEPILPNPPKPLYPDVPWWAVLITAFVFSFLAVVATVVIMNSGAKLPAGAPVPPSIGALAVDTLVYMPHIILLFGVLADMFTYDGVWSIPSLIGILSIFLNFVFQYFWVGINELGNSVAGVLGKGSGNSAAAAVTAAAAKTAAATSVPKPPGRTGPAAFTRSQVAGGKFSEQYDGCSVQGFESLATEYAPQTLVITATVFSYYCFDLVQNRGWVNSIAAVAAFALTYIGQVAIIATTTATGCTVPGKPAVGGLSQAVRALFEGMLFGGTSYGIVKTYYPTRLPSSTVSPFPRKAASDLTMGADGKMRDADGYPYIVLPNGQAVPDLGDRQSRAAFGAMAGTNLGTGIPATAGCSAATGGATLADRLAQINSLSTS